MNFRLFFLFGFALTFESCSSSSIPIHIQVSDRLVSSYIEETKNNGLKLIGSGGSFMHDIQAYDLHYITVQNLDVNAARNLYVKTMETLLHRINHDPKIRPYLHTYPFTIENVKIMSSFKKPDGKRVDSKYVALVFCVKGKIDYSRNVNNTLQDLYEEPYSEALRIVKGE